MWNIHFSTHRVSSLCPNINKVTRMQGTNLNRKTNRNEILIFTQDPKFTIFLFNIIWKTHTTIRHQTTRNSMSKSSRYLVFQNLLILMFQSLSCFDMLIFFIYVYLHLSVKILLQPKSLKLFRNTRKRWSKFLRMPIFSQLYLCLVCIYYSDVYCKTVLRRVTTISIWINNTA